MRTVSSIYGCGIIEYRIWVLGMGMGFGVWVLAVRTCITLTYANTEFVRDGRWYGGVCYGVCYIQMTDGY